MRSYWREPSRGLWGWWGNWSISPVRKGWDSWACLGWRREGWEGISQMLKSIWRMGVKRMGPNSFQWCPATGQGAMGTNWSIGSSVWTWGRTSSPWGWRSTGTGCPGRLWSLLLWRYWRPTWKRSCTACCRWPCFGRRVWTKWSPEVPSNPYYSVILWFCDSVILWFCDCSFSASWPLSTEHTIFSAQTVLFLWI